MRTDPVRKDLLACAALVALLIIPGSYFVLGRSASGSDEPAEVLKNYLRAAYARDFQQAYRFISTQDRRLKEEKIYLRERGAFSGFALEVAKKLAGWIEAVPVAEELNGNHARIKLKLNLPDANRLSEHLLEWEEERLNTLTPSEQRALLGKLEQWHKEGKIPFIEGEEGFALVREAARWRIFLDWAAGVMVSFDASVPRDAKIDVSPPQEVAIQPGELFTIAYRVKNRAGREVSARIRHIIRPAELAQHLDLVECALFIPVTLAPGEADEYSSTYLVRGDLPEGQRRLFVTYQFEVTGR